jgi:hypothetical protein
MPGTGLPAHSVKWGAIRLKITAMSGVEKTGSQKAGVAMSSTANGMADKKTKARDLIGIKKFQFVF